MIYTKLCITSFNRIQSFLKFFLFKEGIGKMGLCVKHERGAIGL